MARNKKVEAEFLENSDSQEEEFNDIYSEDFINELEDNDEIDAIEQGFMEGYLEL